MCLHCDKIAHVDKCGQFLDPENSEDILCKLCIEKERPLAGCYAKANDKVAENDDTDSSIEPYIAAISRKPRANDEMAMDVDSIQPEDIIIEPEDSKMTALSFTMSLTPILTGRLNSATFS